jgi:hypothetical protein
MSFTADRAVLGYVSPPGRWFSPLNINPPTDHPHLHLHIAVTEEQRAKPVSLPKDNSPSEIMRGVGGTPDRKVPPLFVLFKGKIFVLVA